MNSKQKNSDNCKAWYKKNREKHKNRIRLIQKSRLEEIRQLKLVLGCKICGYKKNARALTFHHLDKNKEHDIARMCASGRAKQAILEEINKCICVCFNCHMEIHYSEESAPIV